MNFEDIMFDFYLHITSHMSQVFANCTHYPSYSLLNTKKNEATYEKCSWITRIADDASFIRVFILNHSMRLTMINEFCSLKLLQVADTRFALIIVMLKRLKLIKRYLQALTISDQWASYREDDVGKAQKVKDLILSDHWWDVVDYIIEFTTPIYDMLREVDTDRPCLHLMYEMWDSMIEKVKAIIYQHEGLEANEYSSYFNVVYDILIDRWTKTCTPLHCLAYSLNPKQVLSFRFLFSLVPISSKTHISSSIFGFLFIFIF